MQLRWLNFYAAIRLAVHVMDYALQAAQEALEQDLKYFYFGPHSKATMAGANL